MEYLVPRLRGEELLREAETWRRAHAGRAGAADRAPARQRLGHRLVVLGERMLAG